jgi:hypothetical protein
MIYSTYDPVTGQILCTISNPEPGDIPADAVPVICNDIEHYVDISTKTVLTKPACPGINYQWDWTAKTWQLNISQAEKFSRQQRDSALTQVDRVNPIWYSTLTGQQQSELQAYRSALLAVPQQAGFPTTIEWPTKPVWL